MYYGWKISGKKQKECLKRGFYSTTFILFNYYNGIISRRPSMRTSKHPCRWVDGGAQSSVNKIVFCSPYLTPHASNKPTATHVVWDGWMNG